MKKYIITAFAFITLLTGSVTFTACEDIDDIKELNLDRLLSPTNLTARVRDKVNIELTWDEMDRAQSYVIEVFKEDPDFTGTAISTLESEKATYTVTGLEGETSYSIRVKSVAEGITDSKWVSATRSTDAEQILLEVAEEDLTASEVTLRWPAGQVATVTIVNMLSALGADKKVLIVTDGVDQKVVKSAANIPGVKTAIVGSLNVYDMLNCDKIVIVKSAVEKLQEVYA